MKRERSGMSGKLKDTVAIVVGAGSSGPGWGNGKCTAITFAREGARVFCVDLKRAAAEETVGLIEKEVGPGVAVAYEANASNNADVKAMVDACMAKWGRVDILDNNVGIGSQGGPVELSEDEWHRVFDVNVKSFFLTAKHVLPIMEKQGKGAIVNVSSIASIRSPKGISYLAYNASKGAVNSLTMAIASQYAEKGIRCNAILPGLMHTPMIDFLAEQYAKSEKDHNQAYEKMIEIRDRASPTGKMGTGWDTANAALFLASDQSSYVNGHLLVVDGGITVRA
ncbi:SDR family NAD(P)-dependent oxidoreductase [Reyranella sp.]|jgi:NAD(P)-dependent dehydrogenase (short-subunit alcohol dehydrogenase family)|uniref:SDR family NAD(P)-dependent oxidoreductase n=1 Tax=Reyranella sp. TaxID=1929291 RepID=UPI002720500D|nr:SDR family oxidoreductase [Reyranella sp.]MDO8973335.1 SDR family oxidoreductase [Reyranella sp.]